MASRAKPGGRKKARAKPSLKSAPKKPKRVAPKKKKPKKAAPKKAAPKKAAPKKAAPKKRPKAAPKKPAPKQASGALRLPPLTRHAVSAGAIAAVAVEGLRADSEIMHVEENDFAPCRLVDHGGNRFSLCFDDYKMPALSLFEERGLNGGGYTWEAVADSLVRMRRPDLTPDLTYDSESAMFVALGGRETLRTVAKLIQEAIGDPRLLQEAVNRADPDRLE